MTPQEVAVMLAESRTLQVATIKADGWPHLVPMWFTLERERPAFWTYARSQKVANLRRDPRISVLVEAGDTYEELRGVSIQGRGEIVEDSDAVLALGERIYERYWGPITDEGVRESVRVMGAKRVGVIVVPEVAVSWDHRKLGGGY
jgi:PPOX class probable F420-dependent enzyme